MCLYAGLILQSFSTMLNIYMEHFILILYVHRSLYIFIRLLHETRCEHVKVAAASQSCCSQTDGPTWRPATVEEVRTPFHSVPESVQPTRRHISASVLFVSRSASSSEQHDISFLYGEGDCSPGGLCCTRTLTETYWGGGGYQQRGGWGGNSGGVTMAAVSCYSFLCPAWLTGGTGLTLHTHQAWWELGWWDGIDCFFPPVESWLPHWGPTERTARCRSRKHRSGWRRC